MNIEEFRTAKPHPAKSVFKGYSRAKIASHLNIATTYLTSIMSGYVQPGPELAARIEKLADEFKQAGSNAA